MLLRDGCIVLMRMGGDGICVTQERKETYDDNDYCKASKALNLCYSIALAYLLPGCFPRAFDGGTKSNEERYSRVCMI